MSRYYAVIALLMVILVSGCTEQKPLTEITIPGHGSQVYVFSHDIRESSKVPVNDREGIRNVFLENDEIKIVFDGSSETDNAYFRVVVINIVEKLQAYFAYEGKVLRFKSYYHIGDIWYDGEGEIGKPDLTNALWFLGPDTGAKETSLALKDSTIYLQGTSYRNLTMAGDKLALVVMNVDV